MPVTTKSALKYSAETLDKWVVEAKNRDPVRWLIEGIVPGSGVMLISGQQKRARKTYFVMSLGLGIATGTHPVFTVNESGPVYAVFEEGRDAPTAERFEKICEAHKVDVPDNFHILWRPRVHLDNPNQAKALLADIAEKKPRVVILDPFFRMISGDENRQEDVNKVINTVFDMRDMGTTVILLAHLDKSRGETPTKDIDQQLRGSGVLANSYDVHAALRKYKQRSKHIDLTVRDREGPEIDYTLRWNTKTADFSVTKSPVAD